MQRNSMRTDIVNESTTETHGTPQICWAGIYPHSGKKSSASLSINHEEIMLELRNILENFKTHSREGRVSKWHTFSGGQKQVSTIDRCKMIHTEVRPTEENQRLLS
jgi:hypothetical protein